MNICVYGAASKTIDKSFILAGENLGKELVKHGHSLVYGAGAEGMMGAVARGVHSEKGYILGVVPTFFTNEEILYLKCDKLVRTKTMRERKQIMEDNADAFIIMKMEMNTMRCPTNQMANCQYIKQLDIIHHQQFTLQMMWKQVSQQICYDLCCKMKQNITDFLHRLVYILR